MDCLFTIKREKKTIERYELEKPLHIINKKEKKVNV